MNPNVILIPMNAIIPDVAHVSNIKFPKPESNGMGECAVRRRHREQLQAAATGDRQSLGAGDGSRIWPVAAAQPGACAAYGAGLLGPASV